jgi:hypothetical protein
VGKPDKASRTYFDLLDALRQPDCAVCRLVGDAILHYIDIFIYENINNLARREEIRAAHAFCSIHTSMFMSGYGRLLSLATLQQDVLNNVLRQMDSVIASKPGMLKTLFQSAGRALHEALQPRRDCPLCDYERSQEKVMLGTLIQFIDDPALREAHEASVGLCLPHFYMALDMPGPLEHIIRVEHAALQRLKQDVDAYVHKRNPAYEGEHMDAGEADAPSRAARILAGRIVHRDSRW